MCQWKTFYALSFGINQFDLKCNPRLLRSKCLFAQYNSPPSERVAREKYSLLLMLRSSTIVVPELADLYQVYLA